VNYSAPSASIAEAARIDRHLAAIVESSDDAIISKDLDGTILSWNRSAQRIFGYTADEVIGRPISILIPPERLNEEVDILDRVKKGEHVDHYHTSRRRKDGRLVNISLTVSPVRDASESIIGASKIARDITGQKRADELRNHFSAIVESSDDAILSKDLNGTIQSWNKGAERIFGYTAEEVIGKPITILMPEGRKNEEPQILARVRNGERVDHYETVRQRKDGTLLNISLSVSPIRDSDGVIIGASKIARDITPAKLAQEALHAAREELAKANAELEARVKARTDSLREAVAQMHEFSYTVSHDLRGPVRAMQGYASAMIEDFGDRLDERGREYLQRIVRGSIRMDKLIQGVLIYSKIVQNQVTCVPVSLDSLIPEIAHQYHDMESPQMGMLVKGRLLPVMAHESSLTQAISNLLSNAKKFVAPGTIPKVEIWTERRDQQIRLWIKDNGIGINPKFQSRLFGMFERLNQDDHYEGTGIGLAIVRKAIEKMGGTVGVESDGIHGSSFWIELPAAD
jgi:PAS domain S-box-containing protein